MTAPNYRSDIDGLRAIAVLAVVLFHFGFVTNGYLGVDVFFVISGYLITLIIHHEAKEDRFSMLQFYIRRIRRIFPLVFFINIVALLIGVRVMLPDDLENLSQSIVATNFFSNNILQILTTRNYWDVVNEYKPLLHTWSLGIEEQFYIVYPLVFLALRKRLNWLLPVLVLFTVISLALYLAPGDPFSKFYLIPFRFFELSIGGLCAISFRQYETESNWVKGLLLGALFFILFAEIDYLPALKTILTVSITAALLTVVNKEKSIGGLVLENKVMVWIGKISFSIYMWHQIVLAFSRYTWKQQFTLADFAVMLPVILVLSVITFYLIEQPFRNKNKVSVKTLLAVTSIAFLLTTGASMYVYLKGGIVHDVPELGLSRNNAQRNIHSQYNDRIYALDKDFSDSTKTKVLIIGTSFSRDWANILLESKYKDSIDICYMFDFPTTPERQQRLDIADYIFFTVMDTSEFAVFNKMHPIDMNKTRMVSVKNFGENNGVFYNKRGRADYCLQRTLMEKGVAHYNDSMNREWGDKQIDLIRMVIDEKGTVPVFTPNCKFISQDCRHLTQSGAQFYASIIDTMPALMRSRSQLHNR